MLHEVQHGPPGFPLAVYVNRVSADVPAGTRFIYTHFHHHLEFIWVRGGAFLFDLEGETMNVRTGDIVIVGSDRIHAGSSIEGTACDAVSVVFDIRLLYGESVNDRGTERYLASLMERRYTLPAILSGASDLGARLRDRLAELLTWQDSKEPGWELMMKSLLLQCFFELVRAGAYSPVLADDSRRTDFNTERLKEILLFIDAHLAEKLSVGRLASRLHLSPAHFHAFFRKHTGQSPVEYINDLRLARARALLSSRTSLTVQEAARRVGFENVSYFIRCYKRRYGVTPGRMPP